MAALIAFCFDVCAQLAIYVSEQRLADVGESRLLDRRGCLVKRSQPDLPCVMRQLFALVIVQIGE